MKYTIDELPKKADVLHLYEDAGWYAYTKDMNLLMSALEKSLDVIAVWNESELVGLIRTVGDGLTIVYIQDILVKNSYKRKGIGRELISRILTKYKNVRQIVLLTDDQEETRCFYESLAFTSCDKGATVAFTK